MVYFFPVQQLHCQILNRCYTKENSPFHHKNICLFFKPNSFFIDKNTCQRVKKSASMRQFACGKISLRTHSSIPSHKVYISQILITPPARRAWRSFKFAPFLFFFRCRKSCHRSWVIPLAFLCCLAHCYTSFKPIL